MSSVPYAKTPLHVLKDSNLPLATRAVYAALDAHHNRKTGQCNPSLSRLASYLGVSRLTVIRHLAVLETAGYIGIDRETGLGNHYRLTDPTTGFPASIDHDTTPPVSDLLPDTTPPVSESVPIPVSSEQRGVPILPNSVFEPEEEEPNPPTPLRGEIVWEESFEKIKETYPGAKDRPIQERALWRRLDPGPGTARALAARIVSGIKRWSASAQWQRDGGRYIPKFFTFLHRHQWEGVPAGPCGRPVETDAERHQRIVAEMAERRKLFGGVS